MIQDITIENYGLVHEQRLVVKPGLCVITGETGAGKSMLLGAIHFLFGEKLPIELRSKTTPTRVFCHIDAAYLDTIITTLDGPITQRLAALSGPSIRLERSHHGHKTQTTLAGLAINRTQLKQLADVLLHVHQQHQHLTFLQAPVQRTYLDEFGQHTTLLSQTRTCYHTWQQLHQEQTELEAQLNALDDPSHNQAIVDEYHQHGFDSLDLDQLHQQQKQLQSRQAFVQMALQSVARLDADDAQAVMPSLCNIINDVEAYVAIYPELNDALAALHEALTLLTEAHNQIRTLGDGDFTDDAQAFEAVEQQLSGFYQFARKYQQPPQQLNNYIQTICSSIDLYHQLTTQIANTKQRVVQAYTDYITQSKHLHEHRLATALTLEACINSRLPELALPHARFSVLCDYDASNPHDHGCSSIVFCFSANSGMAVSPLERCASGGELTRLALLLQLSLPQANPKLMVFDEADVGVSGASASLIGNILKQHAKIHPVLCITHSPQVAAKADVHWFVTKKQVGSDWHSAVETLNHNDHIHAVATLLGDQSITDITLANARQLCETE